MPATREHTYVDSEVSPASRVRRRNGVVRSAESDGAAESNRAKVAATLAAATRGLVRLIRLAAAVIAAIIAVGILFVVLEANTTNTIVSTVHDAARALVGPFDDMFELDNAKTAIAVNWGIAAVAYLILGGLIAWLVAMIGTAGLRLRRT